MVDESNYKSGCIGKSNLTYLKETQVCLETRFLSLWYLCLFIFLFRFFFTLSAQTVPKSSTSTSSASDETDPDEEIGFKPNPNGKLGKASEKGSEVKFCALGKTRKGLGFGIWNGSDWGNIGGVVRFGAGELREGVNSLVGCDLLRSLWSLEAIEAWVN